MNLKAIGHADRCMDTGMCSMCHRRPLFGADTRVLFYSHVYQDWDLTAVEAVVESVLPYTRLTMSQSEP